MNVATEKTAERMIVVLNCRQSCIAVSEGNTIRLEIRSAPIMRMPRTIVMAVRKAMIIL